jgi:signal peptidase
MKRHLSLLLMLAALAGWFVMLRPAALGGPATYVMVSGTSMQPTFENGDLVVLRHQSSYRRGDIIVYEVPNGPGTGKLIIHRIIGGDATEGFVTQGDNRDRPDEWRPVAGNVKGSLWVRVPGAGKVLALLRTPPVFAALAGGIAVFVLLMRTPGGTTRREREPVPDAPEEAERPSELAAPR